MTEHPRFTTQLTTPSDREIVITRTFNAPAQRVFQAWTQPEHVRHWYGTATTALVDCQIDLRPGGRYRYLLRDASGREYGFTGEYREVTPPTRLVYTDSFEGMPGHEALVTLTLEEHDGTTTLTSTSLYHSAADRDAHLRSGMEPGMTETLDRLDAHLRSVGQALPPTTNTDPDIADHTALPAADLKRLDRLTGTWRVSGDANGQVRYEWAEGGFFLVQHFDLVHDGRPIKGIEMIGHLRPLDGEPSDEIWTRVYSFVDGMTLDYVYDLDGDTLTIWGGYRGSPAYYQGTFGDDGTTVTGAWQWPGGGYSANMTKLT